jgi:predicted secreted Zn-dependent protease
MAIQRKPAVSLPSDASELEADEVADEVMRGNVAYAAGPIPTRISRACASREHQMQVERAFPSEDAHDAGGVEAIVQHGLSGGRPLDEAVRSHFEPLFGADFGAVRVHTDGRAAASARAMNALAYTRGRDIVFGEGRYAPESHEGRRLLAHELTHTIQQGHAPTSSKARGATSGASPGAAGSVVQRYRVPFAPTAGCAQVVNWINTSGPYAATSGAARTRTPLIASWGRPVVSGTAPNFIVTTPNVSVRRQQIAPDMPQWSPQDPKVKQVWNAAMAKLRAHEAEHEAKGDNYAMLAEMNLALASVQVSAPDQARAIALARPQFAALFQAWVRKLQASHDSIDPYRVSIACP